MEEPDNICEYYGHLYIRDGDYMVCDDCGDSYYDPEEE